jgi:hypothetical protein
LKRVLSTALDLGRAAGRLPEAMRVLADFELSLGRLAATLGIDRRAGMVAAGPPPRVAIMTELRGDEVVLAGRWVPDLAAAAGALALFVDAGGPDVAIPFEDIVHADPDRLVFALRDRAVDDALPVVREVLRRTASRRHGEGFADSCSVLDGARFVNEPAPALARSIELIALACHGMACGVRASPDEIVTLAPAPSVGSDGLPA